MLNNNLFKKHLDADEQMILVVHRHWLVGIKMLFLPTLALFTLTSLLFLLPERVITFAILILLLTTCIWLLRNFFDYFLDAWIITNTGIIDVEWFGWFHRESARVLYSDIQGVSYEVKGLLQTLLQHGTISIEKISTGSSIAMKNVHKPKQIETVILKQMETYLHTSNLRDASTIQDLLINVLAKEMQKKAPHFNQK